MKFRRSAHVAEDVEKSSTVLGKVQKSVNNRKMQLRRQQDDLKTLKMESQEAALEMKACLNKLQELVPFAPKDKTLSKLEVITSAIFYIHDLRETLGLPPCQLTSEDSTSNDFCLELEEQSETILSCPSGIPSSITVNSTVAEKPSVEKLPSSPPVPSVVSYSPNALDTSSFSDHLSQHYHHHIKRQPLCMISRPSNTTGHGQRVSQKS